jgi:ankyrin repeat protein
LIKYGGNVTIAATDGSTPLGLACANGHYGAARLLISQGASVLTLPMVKTPLHYAAAGGFVKVIHLLLENGAYINAVTKLGKTPIMEACEKG